MIPYNNFTDYATNSERIGYAAGKVEQSDMFVVCVFGIIVVFIIILIIWKILNYINKRRAIDEINKKL